MIQVLFSRDELAYHKNHTPAFAASLLSHGSLNAEGQLTISHVTLHEIKREHFAELAASAPSAAQVPQPVPAEPTVLDLFLNFYRATRSWSEAGFPVIGVEAYTLRSDACQMCEHWHPEARLGLGKCAHPKCGCTKLKRWLATEKCPIGKWPTPDANPG